jgi:hypothetical protein
LLRSYETTVSFVEIDPSITTYFNVNRWYLVICVGLISFAVLRAHSYLNGLASLGQVLWALLLAVAACTGTWMRAARYVGFRAAGIGLFFFERAGREDPFRFLQEIAAARSAYLEKHYSAQEDVAPDDLPSRDRDAIH